MRMCAHACLHIYVRLRVCELVYVSICFIDCLPSNDAYNIGRNNTLYYLVRDTMYTDLTLHAFINRKGQLKLKDSVLFNIIVVFLESQSCICVYGPPDRQAGLTDGFASRQDGKC